MGVETAALIGLGGGALGGAIKGGKGTPDQKTFVDQNTSIPGASAQELDLQKQSLAAFQKQQGLADQQSQNISNTFDPLQQQAAQGFSNIMGGQAFNLTADEQARLQAQQQALISQGQAPIERMLEERMRGVVGSAAGRGLRGQALGSLQGQVLQAGAQELGDITRQANSITAQQALQLPQQRIAAQSPFLQQGLTFPEELRQRAIANQNMLQSPALLQSLLQERMAQGSTKQTNTTPGQAGGFGQAILGGLGGAGGGGKIGGDFAKALQQLGFFGTGSTGTGGQSQGSFNLNDPVNRLTSGF